MKRFSVVIAFCLFLLACAPSGPQLVGWKKPRMDQQLYNADLSACLFEVNKLLYAGRRSVNTELMQIQCMESKGYETIYYPKQ